MWNLYTVNDGLWLAKVTTSYFIYEIDFKNLVQTNTKTGTRRVIRRLALGDTGGVQAPAAIPSPIKPWFATAAGDSSADADDDDEDSDDTGGFGVAVKMGRATTGCAAGELPYADAD